MLYLHIYVYAVLLYVQHFYQICCSRRSYMDQLEVIPDPVGLKTCTYTVVFFRKILFTLFIKLGIEFKLIS